MHRLGRLAIALASLGIAVDASQKLKLPTHVGKRVSVTGVLVGREMQVRTLQRVATSCDQKG